MKSAILLLCLIAGAAAIQPSYPDPLLRQYDFEAVASAIEELLESNPSYDDGSYGPVLLRLAWHAAGSYSKEDGTGGSDGATMRFSPEKDYAANRGLSVARDLLEPVKAKFPWISYSDLWSLAGVVAVESMGGPRIPWKWGRVDAAEAAQCPPDGRLPDPSKPVYEEPSHLRAIFGRMGFTDREIVALSGAHGVGRCHADRSGYVGPWTHHPTQFTNKYFRELLTNKWHRKEWNGPEQYEDDMGQLMMLPSDMALLWDPAFRAVAVEYADDEGTFFRDFAKAFAKLQELGVPFPPHVTYARY